jgi:hypothetical protein
MATKVFHFLNTTNANWGQLQEGGSAPAAAASAFGWAVGKVAAGYWRGRIGATALANVSNAASYLTTTPPQQGTGTGITTAGNAFRTSGTYTGQFVFGNWTFSLGMRTGAASHAGRVRCQLWKGVNPNGSDAVKIGSFIGLLAVTLAATGTTYTMTGTVSSVPAQTFDNEYLFIEVEWQGTTAGTSNSCSALFYQSACTLTTPDFVFAEVTGTGALVAVNTTGQRGSGVVTNPPITGTGALVTGGTNYLYYSQDIGQWSRADIDLTSNAAVAPDGTTTAETASSSTWNSVHGLYPDSSNPVGQTTVSIYAKLIAGPVWLQISHGSRWANFNLATGAVGNGNNTAQTVITNEGNGWWRCSMNSNESNKPQFFIAPTDSAVQNPIHAIVVTLALWGAQQEKSNSPTPTKYYATEAGARTSSPVLSGAGNVITVEPPVTGTGALQAVSLAPPPRTNWITWSQDLDRTNPWYPTANGLDVWPPDTLVAPDGSTTAEPCLELSDGVDASRSLSYNQYPIFGNLNPRTLSVYAKSIDRANWFRINLQAGYVYSANFNIADGTLGLVLNGMGASSIQSVGNGWYRCSITTNESVISDDGVAVSFYPMDADAEDSSYVGTGRTISFWGAQLEEGKVATAYIATTTDPVTVSGGAPIGFGTVSWNATGALTATVSDLDAVGTVITPPATGTGALTTAKPTLASLGVSGSGSAAGGVPAEIVITGGDGGDLIFGAINYGAAAEGQAFVSVGTSVTKITAKLCKYGVPTDGLRCRISTADANYLPVALLGTTTIPVSSIPLNATAPVEFTFASPVVVSKDQLYHVAIDRLGAADDENLYAIHLTYGRVYTPMYSYDQPGGGEVWVTDGASNLDITISQMAGAAVPPLQVAAPTLTGVGISRSFGTGVLTTSPAALSGVASGQTSGTGTLTSARAYLDSAGFSFSTGTSSLGASSSGIVGSVILKYRLVVSWFELRGEPIATVVGAGVLAADTATLAGAGVSRSVSTVAALTNTAATIVAPGIAQAAGAGALGATLASLTGLGVSASVGAPALAAQPSAIVASGVARWVMSGTLVAQPVTLVASGVAQWLATSTLITTAATVAGVGISRSVSTVAALQASLASVVGAEGVVVIAGTGSLPSQSAIIAGAGVSRSVSTSGTLTNAAASLAASGAGQTTGTASLLSPSAVLTGTGLSTSLASALLAGQTASLTGTGTARWLATGALPAGFASVVAPGVARWVVSGTLAPAAATVVSFGQTGSVVTTAALQASLAFISGFEGVVVISGTGSLPAQSSKVVAVAVSESRGTGSLALQAVTLAGAGLSRSQGSGTLSGQACTVTAPGIVSSAGTGALGSGAATLFGIASSETLITGSGALSPTVGDIDGTGQAIWTATGTLSAPGSVLAGAGISRWIATAALATNVADVDGAGASRSVGTAALLASLATVFGFEGTVVISGTGSLQAQSRLVSGAGASRSLGTGALLPDNADLSGVAVATVRGTGALNSSAAQIDGIAAAIMQGSGALLCTAASLDGDGIVLDKITGTGVLVSRSSGVFGYASLTTFGSGDLIARDHALSGLAVAEIVGHGTLRPLRSAIEADGISDASGEGYLAARRALMLSFGDVEDNITGYGAMTSRRALMLALGVTGSTGAGVLFARTATVVGGVKLVDGAGVLIAGNSNIAGHGFVGITEVPWGGTQLPGGYPGTAPWIGAGTTTWKGGAACWTNPGTSQWRNPGTTLPPKRAA